MHSPIIALILILAAAPQDSANRERVHYTVDASPHAEGKVSVTMRVEGILDDTVSLAMPTWAPGAYRLVNYSKGISDFGATADKKELKVDQPDDHTWKVDTGGASRFTVSYTISLPDSGRGGISKSHCDLQGPDTYMYVVGHKKAPCSVAFKLPDDWKVATGLSKKDDVYSHVDYDRFIDCPTELGTFKQHDFDIDDVRYEVVVHADGDYDDKTLVDMCRKVAKEQTRMMGGVPFKRYVFIYHFRIEVPGGGGLEHLNSTSIALPYAAIKNNAMAAAGVTSHEFFHLWNVKRIRPKVLGPFDYTGPVRTRALWMCEGVTSYYGSLALKRSGIWNRKRYLDSLDRQIETLRNNPDHLVTSAEKASWTVWDRRTGRRISYYNKGLLIGLLIDLEMRHRTNNEKSFDDVLRHLNVKYAKEHSGPIGVGYPEDGIEKAVNEVSGHDFTAFFDKYVSGLEELPYEKTLAYAGIACEMKKRASPGLGVIRRRMRVSAKLAGAETSLEPGDRILKINGEEVDRSSIRRAIRNLEIGDDVTITVRRDGEEEKLEMKVQKRIRLQCSLSWVEEPTDLQKRIRESWLTGSRN